MERGGKWSRENYSSAHIAGTTKKTEYFGTEGKEGEGNSMNSINTGGT